MNKVSHERSGQGLVYIRVTTITIRDEFQEERAFLFLDSPSAGILDSLTSCDDVHSVDLEMARCRM